jgi:hypothetical protein
MPACSKENAKDLLPDVFKTQEGMSMAVLNQGAATDPMTGKKTCGYKIMFGYKNYSDETYDGSCSFFGGTPPLKEYWGWIITILLGCVFAFIVGVMVHLSNRGLSDTDQTGTNSEVFTTAGRTISAGLTAADVVSKWTWAATLLQSSNVAWQYGVSGPFWYASGATVQVLLFAILAIQIKQKCPAIHTMLEVVFVRWGARAHLVFIFYGLLTCLIVTAMLILGGAATINALTGANLYGCCFTIPVPVMVYTAFGGLKGTYYASYTHTGVIYIALLIFIWKIYAGPSDLGSSDKMRENLICAARRQVAGDSDKTWNYEGQYITMRSTGGLMFGIMQLRHRLRRPVLLAGRYRLQALGDLQGLPARRHGLVRDPVLHGHCARSRGPRARPPHHRRRGWQRSRTAGGRNAHDGPGRRLPRCSPALPCHHLHRQQ